MNDTLMRLLATGYLVGLIGSVAAVAMFGWWFMLPAGIWTLGGFKLLGTETR